MKRLFIKTLVAAAAVVAFGGASAAPIGEHTIKFATQNPKGHPIVMGLEKFAAIVQTKSGGTIKVNLFPGGTLGGDQANVSALQGGTLEMASMNSGTELSNSSPHSRSRSVSAVGAWPQTSRCSSRLVRIVMSAPPSRRQSSIERVAWPILSLRSQSM